MKALIVAPHERPVMKNLLDLKDMQHCVGGYIQAIYPWDDLPVALVCDEEGLYHDSDWNRVLPDGTPIKGTFFLCGVGEEDFTDLTDELAARFEREFSEPDTYITELPLQNRKKVWLL